jgi:hypothetical protein
MKFLKEENGCYHFSDGGRVVKVAKNAVGPDFIKKYNQGGVIEVPAVTNPTMLKKKKSLHEKLYEGMEPGIDLPRVSQERGHSPQPHEPNDTIIHKAKIDYNNSNIGGDIKKAFQKIGEDLEDQELRGYNQGGRIPQSVEPTPIDPVYIDGNEVLKMAQEKGLNENQKRAALQLYYMESGGGKDPRIAKPNKVGAQGGFQVTTDTLNTLKRNGYSRQNLDLSNPRDAVEAGLDNIKYNSSKPNVGADTNNLREAHIGGPGSIGKPARYDYYGTSTKDYANPNSDRVKRADQYASQYLPQSEFRTSSQEKPFYQRENQSLDQAMNFNPNNPAIFSGVEYPSGVEEVPGNMFNVEGQQRMVDARTAEQDSYIAGYRTPVQQEMIATRGGVPGGYQGPGSAPEQVPPYKLAAQENQRLIQQAQGGQGSQYQFASGQAQQQQPMSAYGMQNLPQQYQEIYDAKSGALQTQANSQEMQRQAEVKYADTLAKQQQDMINRQNELLQRSNDQIDLFTKDYLANKVDPNRLFKNASTGRQFTGAIGLILSGIGAALTGQPSQALMVIDRAIDRDIEAQKLEIGKGKTILDVQLQKYGNERDAIQATRIALGAQALAEMEKAKAMARKPEIKAALEMNQANLKLALVQNMLELNNKYLNYGATTGAFRLKEGTPEYYRAIGNNPDLVEKMYVDGNGEVYFAKRKDNAEKVDQYMTNFHDLEQSLDNLYQFDSVSTKIPLTKQRQLAASEYKRAIGNFMSNESAKVASTRLSELEFDIAESIIQDPRKWNTVHFREQLDAVKEILQHEKENFLRNNLIGYTPKQSLKNKAKSKGFTSAN